MAASARLFTGISRDKPVFWQITFLIAYLILTIFFLKRLTKQILKETIPAFYRASRAHDHINTEELEWKYFMAGSLLLAPTFISMRNAGNERAGLEEIRYAEYFVEVSLRKELFLYEEFNYIVY